MELFESNQGPPGRQLSALTFCTTEEGGGGLTIRFLCVVSAQSMDITVVLLNTEVPAECIFYTDGGGFQYLI